MESSATLLRDMNAESAQAGQETVDIAALIRQQAGVQQNIQTEAKEAASGASLIANQEGHAKLATQVAATTAARAIGGDVTDATSEVITGLGQEMRETFAQTQEAMKAYRRVSEVNFFDNPIGWIHANVMGGADQARTVYNNVATQYNTAEDRLKDVTAATTAEAIAQRQLEQTESEASIAAKATVAAFQYNRIAGEAAYNVLGSNINALKEMQSGKLAALNLRIKGWEISRQEAMFGLQVKAFNMQYEQYKEKKEGDMMLQDAYTRGMAAYGSTMPTDMNFSKFKALYNTPQGRKELQPILDRGIYSLAHGGDISFGDSPGRVIMDMVQVQPRFEDTNKFQGPAKYLAELYQNIPATVNKKVPAEVEAYINNAVAHNVVSWNGNAEGSKIWADKGVNAVIKANPAVAETAFFKQVLEPSVVAGTQQIPAKQMLSITASAMNKKLLTIEEATAGMALYYKSAIALNNIANAPLAIPTQKNYAAKPGLNWMGEKSVNFADPVQITNLLLRQKNSYSSPAEAQAALNASLQ